MVSNSVTERALYEKGIAWIAYQRGGHNGQWPPYDPVKCSGWAVVRMLSAVHDRSAFEVASDLIDYVRRSERGFRQP